MRTLNLKGILCLAVILLFFQISQAQVSNVSIGTEAIKNNAILWLKSNGNQGILLPVIANRSNFTGLNNTDDKGMLIYDASDNKVYYWNGSAWVEVGGVAGGGGGEANTASNVGTGGQGIFKQKSALNLEFYKINAGSNKVSVALDAANNEVDIDVNSLNLVVAATQVTGLGTLATLSAITSAQITDGSITSADILDGEVRNADLQDGSVTGNKLSIPGAITGQVLKFNGSTWTAQADDVGAGATPTLANGQLLTGNGTANSATAITGDIALSGGAMTIKTNVVTTGMIQALAVDGTKLADNSVNSAKISDGTITSADILDATISSLDIANGGVATVDILDGAITGAKISTTGATSGQVLKYNGTTWLPQDDNTGSSVTLANGQLLTGNGTTNSATTITGDIALSGGAMTIKPNVVTTGMIQALAVDGTKLADNSVNSAKITDGSITSADILDATISSLDIANGGVATVDILDGAVTGAKISTTGATSGQVLKYNGTTWLPQDDNTGSTATLANGQLLTGNGTTNSATTITGDIALSGGAMTIKTNVVTTGMIQNLAVDGTKLADNSVNSAKITDGSITSADILDAAIVNADVAAAAAIVGTKISPNFGSQNIVTTGSATTGNLNVTGTLAPGASTNVGTSGQFLTSQGAGTPPTWFTLFNTANQVPMGNGTTLVSSNLYSNGTNFGIGTTNPRSILELQGGNLILSGDAGAPDDPVDIDFRIRDGAFKAKIWTNPNPLENELWFSTSTAGPFRKDITIDKDGNVGIAQTAPTFKLDVNGTLRCFGLTDASDVRYKKDIVTLENSLDKILKLRGVEYTWRQSEFKDINFNDGRQVGFIAQEVEKVVPELVNEDNEGFKSVQYANVSAILVEAVKEQQQLIEALKKELDQVKNERQNLESENKLLESKVNSIQQDVEEIKRILSLQATKN